jgi:hypothetical protein
VRSISKTAVFRAPRRLGIHPADNPKSGKRSELEARLSYTAACDSDFLGSLDYQERLIGASAKR